MELRDRLSRLGYFGAGTRTAGEQAAAKAPAQPQRMAQPPMRPSSTSSRPDVGDLLDGTNRQCDDGTCFVAESRFALDHVHGGVALSDLLAAPTQAFALLTGDQRLAEVDLERVVLVDTETTGLAGGTGTFVFMIGLGYFAAGHFRIEQFFLRDPSEERAMLRVLGSVLGQFEAVVTFNGKCFDWPLIETRHFYHRVPLRPSAPPHLDLLFPARRLFKRRVASCALDQLEVDALGMGRRLGDVPGFLIPTLYFDYLRARDGRPLVPVFEHNRRDILTMLSLAVKMARAVDDPTQVDDATDLYSLGRLFDDTGLWERAIPCYERALSTTSQREEVLTRLSGAYKRLKDAERAVDLWQCMVRDGAGSIYPYVELAKHLEHRRRDHHAAAALTRRAIGLHGAVRAATPPRRYAVERADLDRRLRRLERKLAS